MARRNGLRYTGRMGGEGKAALWTFLGMAIGFKLATSLLIFSMQPSLASAAFLFWMNWYWLVLPFVVVGLPGLFWFRLMRVRAKRRALIRAEWQVEPVAGGRWSPAPSRGPTGSDGHGR